MENQNNPHQIPSSTPTRLPIREPKPLSCISCRLKKIKCDRFNPCSACLRTSTDCIQPSRQRLPRGREGGRKNTELLNRLRRLEGLVEKYEKPDNARISEATVKQRSSSGKSDEVEIDPIEGDVKISNGDRVAERTEGGVGCYLGAAFWGNLCNEVSLYTRYSSNRPLMLLLRSKVFDILCHNHPMTKKRRKTPMDIQNPFRRSIFRPPTPDLSLASIRRQANHFPHALLPSTSQCYILFTWRMLILFLRFFTSQRCLELCLKQKIEQECQRERERMLLLSPYYLLQ